MDAPQPFSRRYRSHIRANRGGRGRGGRNLHPHPHTHAYTDAYNATRPRWQLKHRNQESHNEEAEVLPLHVQHQLETDGNTESHTYSNSDIQPHNIHPQWKSESLMNNAHRSTDATITDTGNVFENDENTGLPTISATAVNPVNNKKARRRGRRRNRQQNKANPQTNITDNNTNTTDAVGDDHTTAVAYTPLSPINITNGQSVAEGIHATDQATNPHPHHNHHHPQIHTHVNYQHLNQQHAHQRHSPAARKKRHGGKHVQPSREGQPTGVHHSQQPVNDTSSRRTSTDSQIGDHNVFFTTSVLHSTQHSPSASLYTLPNDATNNNNSFSSAVAEIMKLRSQVEALESELSKYKSLAEDKSVVASTRSSDVRPQTDTHSHPETETEAVTSAASRHVNQRSVSVLETNVEVLSAKSISSPNAPSQHDESIQTLNSPSLVSLPFAHLLAPPLTKIPLDNDYYDAVNSGPSSSSEEDEDEVNDDTDDDANDKGNVDEDEDDGGHENVYENENEEASSGSGIGDESDTSELSVPLKEADVDVDDDGAEQENGGESEENEDEVTVKRRKGKSERKNKSESSLQFSDSQIEPDDISSELGESDSSLERIAMPARPIFPKSSRAWTNDDPSIATNGNGKQHQGPNQGEDVDDSIIHSIVAAFANQAAITPKELAENTSSSINLNRSALQRQPSVSSAKENYNLANNSAPSPHTHLDDADGDADAESMPLSPPIRAAHYKFVATASKVDDADNEDGDAEDADVDDALLGAANGRQSRQDLKSMLKLPISTINTTSATNLNNPSHMPLNDDNALMDNDDEVDVGIVDEVQDDTTGDDGDDEGESKQLMRDSDTSKPHSASPVTNNRDMSAPAHPKQRRRGINMKSIGYNEEKDADAEHSDEDAIESGDEYSDGGEEHEDVEGYRHDAASEDDNASEVTVSTYHTSRSRSGSSSGSSVTVSVSSEWHDQFPFEANLFLLSRCYDFINRVYTCRDAVTFRAISKATGNLVCIKMSDDYSPSRSHDPKEVRLLARVQGHPRICRLEAWHPLPETHCYAIVMEWVHSTSIEDYLFGNLLKIRQYMYDLLSGLRHMHQRGVLYRDIKPSNVLWNDDENHATYIDYDVATFYDATALHRSIVGTDGYMAPEVLAIDTAKRQHAALPYVGYGLEADVYSSGVVFGSLLFQQHEDEVADLKNSVAKGDAYLTRVLVNPEEDAHPPELIHAYNLMVRMLDPDVDTRITVEEALAHPFFTVEGADYLKHECSQVK